jgi:two-component system, chemotaxis family, protein-glutamate methylesterase/glutaminase
VKIPSGLGEGATFHRDLIVIGTSAGGFALLRELVAKLPADFGAAVFVVMHTAPDGPGFLAEILGGISKVPVMFPKDGQTIETGRVYVAPPDHHILVDPGRILVVRGPRENQFRPAIDPLFRSAAAHYGRRVIGVILSGLLDDGASGLLAVKQCGGVAVVQDPKEADFPEMIVNARRAVPPDYTVSVKALPELFARLMQEPLKGRGQIEEQAARVKIEADLASMRRTGAAEVNGLGKLSRLVCPECNGALWELHDPNVLRYRCHIGHAFSAESLAADQSQALERALSVALRTLDDSAALAGRLASEAEEQNRLQTALIFRRRAGEARKNGDTLRAILQQQNSLRLPPENRDLPRLPNG